MVAKQYHRVLFPLFHTECLLNIPNILPLLCSCFFAFAHSPPWSVSAGLNPLHSQLHLQKGHPSFCISVMTLNSVIYTYVFTTLIGVYALRVRVHILTHLHLAEALSSVE